MIATRRFLPALLAASLLIPCAKAEVAPPPSIKEQPDFGKHFAAQGLTGTFALLDPEANTLLTWNATRAKERFIPASTFKIANSLIGLETGAVKGLDEVLPYGGKPQPFKEWEHDMALPEAMKLSAVPIYQELARRIGAEKMAAGVKSLGYGNADTTGAIDRFWLDGPLKISAVEQTDFIRRLLADELPLKKETMQQVRGMIPTERAGDAVIHFKTGWCTSTEPNIGWIVGWVERGGKTQPFALNIDMKEMKDAPKRMELVKACLGIPLVAAKEGKPAAIAIQPLGKVNAERLTAMKEGLEKSYGLHVDLLEKQPLPKEAWYEPRERYRAEKLLDHLEAVVPAAQAAVVIGITEKDISTTKDEHEDWGIFGLGSLEGRTCVVSTFRLGARGADETKLHDRLRKVAIHEVGHVAGLPHCLTVGCVMRDAESSILTVDAESGDFCAECKIRASEGLAKKGAGK